MSRGARTMTIAILLAAPAMASGCKKFRRATPDHLVEEIENKFGIGISIRNWNHWNGGVFLFDDSSHELLETWHQATMEIFKDKKWKTRDQGTLAMTAWKFGLQNNPTLPIEYNFIADYNSDKVGYLGELSFSYEGSKRIVQPNFIHVYHHWGDASWPVWRDVKNHFA